MERAREPVAVRDSKIEFLLHRKPTEPWRGRLSKMRVTNAKGAGTGQQAWLEISGWPPLNYDRDQNDINCSHYHWRLHFQKQVNKREQKWIILANDRYPLGGTALTFVECKMAEWVAHVVFPWRLPQQTTVLTHNQINVVIGHQGGTCSRVRPQSRPSLRAEKFLYERAKQTMHKISSHFGRSFFRKYLLFLYVHQLITIYRSFTRNHLCNLTLYIIKIWPGLLRGAR